MSVALKQETEPDLTTISRWQWFAWFLMAVGAAATMLVAAAVWDWMR